ncbi:MAG: hypothetical protein PWP42_118 [Candidatus Atribacteria bacterium]|jgi:parvulin-like peptidyl-prolyl isomerase|uniref:SurA N-terminal domain-containing protein n=1 Tax=Atrimonas thermophila TaxID=3064161 RepID=UPI0024AB790A|nr:hypothetical protein [Candidatus Atribacteria bacterium]
MMRSLRKNLDVILIIVVVAFAVTIYYGYGAYRRSGRTTQAAAATVNNTVITFSELDTAFRNLLSRYDSKTLNQMDEKAFEFLRMMTLENLINNELLYQEARSRKIKVSAQEIEEQLNAIKANFPSEKEFNDFLSYQRLSLPVLRESIKRELMIQKLIDSLAQDIEIPEEEIQKYYDEHISLFTTPAQYHLRQITVPSQEEADKALKRIYLGEDFSKVAQEISQDQYASNGGDLGWVSEALIPEEARGAIKELADQPNAVTGVIKIGDLYRIYQVLEFKPEQVTPFEEAKEDIRKILENEQKNVRLEHLISELREKSTITISEALKPQESQEAESESTPQGASSEDQTPATSENNTEESTP